METTTYRIVDAAKRLRKLFDRHVREVGMTAPQARLLMLVAREPEQTQSFYAAELEVEPITLCRMVDRMEDGGLLERHADPADRRARLVGCSPQGQEKVNEMRTIVDQFNIEMMSAFTPEERDTIERGLKLMSDRINTMTEEREAANG